MQYTANLHLNLPEDTDPLEVSKLSENFEVLDAAVGDTSGTAALVKSMKIGDITYSTRNLEAESGGVLIACDQREVLTSAYPELCAIDFMRDRYSFGFREHPTRQKSAYIATPSKCLRVGNRYIPIGDKNASILDLTTGETRTLFSSSGYYTYYIDDNVSIIGNDALTDLYAVLLPNGATNRKMSGVSAYQILRFGDKYLFVLKNLTTSIAKNYYAKWCNASDMLNGSTTTILTYDSTYTTLSGYTTAYSQYINFIQANSDEIPFCGAIQAYNNTLYTLEVVRNVSDSSDTRLGLFSSSDGVNWAQVYQFQIFRTANPRNFYIAFGFVDGKLYVFQSFGGDYYVTITVLDASNLTQVRHFELEGYAYNSPSGVAIKDNFLYVHLGYKGNGATSAKDYGAAKINLETGNVLRPQFPEWVVSSSHSLTNVYNTPIWPEVSISLSSSYPASGQVSMYEFERGKATALTVPNTALISDPVDPLYEPIHNFPYNPEYVFKPRVDGPIMVYPMAQTTRVLPYIRNGYMKVLNEEVSE